MARGRGPLATDSRQHAVYRGLVVWCLVSPLVWTLPGMPDFVTLTLVANSAQVVLLPLLAGGVWWITASARFIGAEYRNRPLGERRDGAARGTRALRRRGLAANAAGPVRALTASGTRPTVWTQANELVAPVQR